MRRTKSQKQNTSLATHHGFTLVELLMVVAIIGIVAAIALPQILTYRQSGFDALAKSDLRNAANAEEAYFLSQGTYLNCSNDACVSQLPNFRLSDSVSITMVANNGAQPTFTGSATSSGGKYTFNYDSAGGGMLN